MATLRSFLASNFWSLLTRRPFIDALALWYGGSGSILSLHRIVNEADRSRLDQNAELELTTGEFECVLSTFQKRGYRFVSIDHLVQALREGRQGKKLIALTFDDGYLDNLMLALPIARKFSAPITVYVATGFPDRTVRLWWYALEQLLHSRATLEITHGGYHHNFRLDTAAERETCFARVKNWILSCSESQQEELFRNLGISPETFLQLSERLACGWEALRRLSTDPLVTIGAHSVSHKRLSNLLPEELEDELLSCRRILEEKIGEPVLHFAYPFGDKDSCGPREFEAVRSAGYLTGVTTRTGNFFPEHRDFLHALPRQTLSWGKSYSLSNLLLQMSGYVQFRAHKLNRLVIH